MVFTTFASDLLSCLLHLYSLVNLSKSIFSSSAKQEATATVTASSTTETPPTGRYQLPVGNILYLYLVSWILIYEVDKRAFRCQKVQLADLSLSPLSSSLTLCPKI